MSYFERNEFKIFNESPADVACLKDLLDLNTNIAIADIVITLSLNNHNVNQ